MIIRAEISETTVWCSYCRSQCIWSLIWAVCLEKCQHASVSCVEENLKIDWWTVADNTLSLRLTGLPARTLDQSSHTTLWQADWQAAASCCKLLLDTRPCCLLIHLDIDTLIVIIMVMDEIIWQREIYKVVTIYSRFSFYENRKLLTLPLNISFW